MMYVTFESKLTGETHWITSKSGGVPNGRDDLVLAWLEGWLGTGSTGNGIVQLRNFKVIREG
jgi:hypothetical protein